MREVGQVTQAIAFAVAEAREDCLWFRAAPFRRQWTRALWEARLWPTEEEAAANCQGEEQRVFPLVLLPSVGNSDATPTQAI